MIVSAIRDVQYLGIAQLYDCHCNHKISYNKFLLQIAQFCAVYTL